MGRSNRTSVRRTAALLAANLLVPLMGHAESLVGPTDRVDQLERRLEAAEAALVAAREELAELHDADEVSPAGLLVLEDDSALQLAGFCETCVDGCQTCRPKRFQLTPYGAVYGEMLASDSTFSLRGSPLFVAPGPAPGIDDTRFTVSGQQSLLGVNIAGPNVGALQSSANVAVNFFGEQPIANNPGLFFLFAYAELANENWRFWVGQAPDAIGRQNSNSPAWTSHKMQGNVGQLRPGFRVERYYACSDQIDSSLYFGLTQQAVNDFIAVPDVAGIDNGWPNVELRWETTLGEKVGGKRPILFAVGGLVGETRAVDNLAMVGSNVSTTWAIIPELRIEGDCFGFQGEAFVGQAIGTYNGGIGQSLNPDDGEAIYSVGGFGEVFWKVTPWFTASIGYGIDNPRDRDLGMVTSTLGQRSRNEAYWINAICQLSEEWEARFEISHLETRYATPSQDNNSMIYHFLLRYAF